MENASKALLIAAGVLIVILIVTIGIKILSPIEGTKQSAAEVGQSLSEKTSSAISSILGIEEEIPETPVEYFEYTTDWNGCGVITGIDQTLNGEITEINIPSKIGDIEIKKINIDAFEGCDQIKTVYISEGITELGWDAFKNCKNITNITLPSTLRTIGIGAFCGVGSGNTEGIKELEVPNGVEEIKTETFDSSNIKKVIIPSSVTTIGTGAFEYSKVEEIVIEGNNLQTIGNMAFNECTELRNINFPKSLKNIYSNAFQRCFRLDMDKKEERSIILPGGITNISQGAFSGCGNKIDGKGCKIYMPITEEEYNQKTNNKEITFKSGWNSNCTVVWKE